MKSLKKILKTTYAHTLGDPINFFREHKKPIIISGLILGSILCYIDAKYIKPTPLNQDK